MVTVLKKTENKYRKRNREWEASLSLWALLVRSSLYKILCVPAVMTLAEFVLYRDYLNRGNWHSLGETVEGSHISMVFLAGMGIVLFILVRTEGLYKERSSGTLDRLRLGESRIFVIETIYNIFCLSMLFAVQIWISVWLVQLYGKAAEGIYESPQRLFLAFYQIDFLHCLLPMADYGKWVRNLLLLLAFGTEAAVWSSGRKEKSISMIAIYALTLSWFVSSLERSAADVFLFALYAAAAALNIRQVRKREKERAV